MATLTGKAADVFEDLGYNSRKWAKHVLGKAGIKGAAELAVGAIAGSEGFNWAVVGVAAPVAAALSASLVQGDHLHRRASLLNEYRNEIASWLNKQDGGNRKPGELRDADLDLAGFGDRKRGINGNPVLRESLEQSAKERNWGVAISAISTVLSTVVVGGMLHQPMEGLNLLTKSLIGGAVGFAMYMPISTAIHWVAETMFGLEKVTVNDRIKDMSRVRGQGKEVSQGQVFEAFLQAHPEMNRMIRAGFGKRFAKLSEQDKQKVMAVVGPQLNLAQITDDINHDRMRPEELAFKLYEQQSGVTLGAVARPHRQSMGQTWAKMFSLFTHHAQPKEQAAPAPATESTPEHVAVAVQSADGREQAAAEAYREDKPGRKVSFVQMVGRKKGEDGSRSFTQMVGRREAYQTGSFAEVVEQSRSSTEVQQVS